MRKLLSLIFLIVAGFLFSCIGREGARLGSMRKCTVTVRNVDDLQKALTDAQSNSQDDVICIREGTYQVTQTLTYSTPDGDSGHKLTIKAKDGLVVLDGGNNVQILFIDTDSDNNANTSDAGADVTIEGIIFRNGSSSGVGGGLRVKTGQANVTLINNTFSGNTARETGGGATIGTDFGTITLTNNTFSGNTAQNGGGGASVVTRFGNITLTNNTFSDNTAEWDSGGAFVGTYFGTITLTNNTFSNNTARIHGGGAFVYSDSGTVTLTNNTFSGNIASIFGGGAFVSTRSGILTLTNNTFNGNIAEAFGGGVLVNIYSGTVTLTNNTFSNNTARMFGGGAYVYLYEDQTTANVYSNIFWQNTANIGGNDGDDLYVNNDGDGNDTASTVNLKNNNFSENANFVRGKSEDLYITLVQQGRYNQVGNIRGEPPVQQVGGGTTGGGGSGGCSMGAGASPVNSLLWLLVPALVLARRIRKNL